MGRTLSARRLGAVAAAATMGALAWALGGDLSAQGRGGAQGQTQTQQQQQQQQGQRGGGGGGRGQGRDVQQQPAVGTGTIAGTVTSAGAGTPVRRARVTLNGAELRGGRTTMTDDNGVFNFIALPAGRYTMRASKAGYVDIPYGAKRPGRPGTPIQLGDGQKIDRADISLPKGGVVTGFVVDEHGEPSPGTPVRVMRFVTQTGERTLQQAGQDTTDDRGQYRVYGLQPGDYLVSAAPRNQNFGNVVAEVEALMQQLQALNAGRGGRGGDLTGAGGGAGGGGGGGGGGGRRGGGAGAIDAILGGGRGAAAAERAAQLQQQLAQQAQEQPTAYAPVYYPGTTAPGSAVPVSLGVGEERPGVDFQLQLVQTATVTGRVASSDGALPQGVQVSLTPSSQTGMPQIPGVGSNSSRVQADGSFSFDDVAPGQYTIFARAAIRQAPVEGDAAANARGGGRGGQFGAGGRGGRGQGQIVQILWAASDINVAGQDIADVQLQLQGGMTVTGRVAFEGSTITPPADMTRVQVRLTPRGAQQFEAGVPPAQVDTMGVFTITGVPPGKYTLQASAPSGGIPGGRGDAVGFAGVSGGVAGGAAGGASAQGGGRGGGGGGGGGGGPQWVLKSAVVRGRDALDFPIEIGPNENISSAIITFTDRTQEVSGTIQDATGLPTADYTIIIFPSDNQYWVPQSRRIQSARPDTAGRFTFRNLPAGDYRLTAVIDVEPGEWYDPNFLQQIVSYSTPITLAVGERKTQVLRVAGGGQ